MLEGNRDRGTKKWTAMMLTEHVEKLNKFYAEYDSVDRPQFDEWELTLLAEEIERAHKSKASVKLTYWNDGKFMDDYGIIINVDNASKTIVLDDPFGTRKYNFTDITAVSVIE